MGQAPLVVSVATEVEASCDDVWAVLVDIENLPSIVTPILSMERLSSGNDYKVGTRWKEVRQYDDEPMNQIKTVTSIRQDENGGRIQKINVFYPDPDHQDMLLAGNMDITNTSTIEVRPLDGKKDTCMCVLQCSFGVMAGGLRGRCFFFLCGRHLARIGGDFVFQELQEIGKAAVELREKQSTSD